MVLDSMFSEFGSGARRSVLLCAALRWRFGQKNSCLQRSVLGRGNSCVDGRSKQMLQLLPELSPYDSDVKRRCLPRARFLPFCPAMLLVRGTIVFLEPQVRRASSTTVLGVASPQHREAEGSLCH